MDHGHDIIRGARRQESSMAPGPAGLEPSDGHFNPAREDLRALSYVAQSDGLLTATADGLGAAGEVPSAPSTPAERAFLVVWPPAVPRP
jgi:hypothetical protein